MVLEGEVTEMGGRVCLSVLCLILFFERVVSKQGKRTLSKTFLFSVDHIFLLRWYMVVYYLEFHVCWTSDLN